VPPRAPFALAAAALTVAAALGCPAARVIKVAVGANSFDLVFPVVVGEANGPLRVLAPFTLVGGQIADGADPVLVQVASDSGERLFLVALDRVHLKAIEPGYDPTRQNAVRLSVGTPPAAPLVHDSDGTRALVDHALPATIPILRTSTAGTLVAVGGDASAAARSQLVLTMPALIEPCPAGDQFRSFLADVPSSTTTQRVRVARLDADSVLVLSLSTVSVFRRGDASSQPNAQVALPPLRPGEYIHAISMGLGPAGPTRELLVAGYVSPVNGVHIGALWDLELAATATAWSIRSVRTASSSPVGKLLDARFDLSGRAYVMGEEHRLWVREPGSAAFLSVAAPPTPVEPSGSRSEFELMIPTGYPSGPHLIAGVFRLWLGDLERGSYHEADLVGPSADALSFICLTATKSLDGMDVDLWAVGHESSADTLWKGHASDGAFAEAALDLPLAYSCPLDNRKRPTSMYFAALSGDALYVATDCNAVLRVRRSDSCVSLIRTTDSVGPASFPMRALDTAGGFLTVVSDGGAIYELPL
jgi:hypothetical protein